MNRKRTAVAMVLFLAAMSLLAAPSAAADTWAAVASGGIAPGFNGAQSQASCAALFGGSLYVGTRNMSGCEVWRYSGSGASWTRVMDGGFGDQNNREAASMCVYDAGTGPRLYVGTAKQDGGSQVWSYDGASWSKASTALVENAGNTGNVSMAVLGGDLWVGDENMTDGCQVFAYNGSWAQMNASGFDVLKDTGAASMALYGGVLWVGTYSPTGCRVFSWSGAAWIERVGPTGAIGTGFGDLLNTSASSMAENMGRLWVGTSRVGGCEIYNWDGAAWTPSVGGAAPVLPGFGDPDNAEVTRLVDYTGGGPAVLYAGVSNLDTGCEVWRDFGGWANVIGPGGGATLPSGFGDADNESVPSMLQFGNDLVAGTSQGLYVPPSGCQVWRMAAGGGAWNQINENGFGSNCQVAATCSASFGGDLYVGTDNRTTGGRIWRYQGAAWSEVTIPGFSYHNSVITEMVVSGSALWVGTRNEYAGCQVFAYNGSAWTQMVGMDAGGILVASGFGTADNAAVTAMAADAGHVWVGTVNQSTGCQAWEYDGAGWALREPAGFGDAGNTAADAMAFFAGSLYAGTWNAGGCEVYKWLGGGWQQIVGSTSLVGPGFGDATNMGVESFANYASWLYAGTYNSTGCEVWRYTGAEWSSTELAGFGNPTNEFAASMAVVGGRLYVSTDGDPGQTLAGEVDMTCGGGWRKVCADGFGDAGNSGIPTLSGHGSLLYAGTANRDTGFEVYRGVATPTVSNLTPGTADIGSQVTLTGYNFGSERGTSRVDFGAVAASQYDSWGEDQVTCRVPAGVSGVVPVTLTTALGTSDAFNLTVPAHSDTWYLAEGTSDWGFDTYVTMENPNATAVTAKVTYMTSSGMVPRDNITLPALSQTTINPRNDIGAKDFSTKVECLERLDIAVDRRMIWQGGGAPSPEGHCSIGVTAPAATWYLPEGSSRWGFETWLLIQNPGAATANCTLTYMIEGEGPRPVSHSVPPYSRATFNMKDDIGEKDASVMVTSEQPVIPERAMYRHDRREGHDSIGTTTPATAYYLAEGTTDWGFTTYVLVQNPNASEATVSLNYMTTTGPVPQAPFIMPAQSRKTINVNQAMPSKDFSTTVSSDKPVIAERAMYWGEGSAKGEACHDSIGMSGAHTTFYLPDGETQNGYETWTLVQNPNASDVTIEVKYLPAAGGTLQEFTDTVPANSRRTYSMADKVPSGRAAVVVRCTTPGMKIMCERAMYWNGRGAGTDTIGGYSD